MIAKISSNVDLLTLDRRYQRFCLRFDICSVLKNLGRRALKTSVFAMAFKNAIHFLAMARNVNCFGRMKPVHVTQTSVMILGFYTFDLMSRQFRCCRSYYYIMEYIVHGSKNR